MPSFLPGFGVFAVAGLIAAAAPLIIHLLNRRRFRVINWAAMDFLREALQRNRRILQLRDIVLLVLRTACVLLFGLALARPFFASSSTEFDPGQAIHGVLIVDNSLSMGFQKLEDTMLDEAKDRAAQFIDGLPEGSRVSVIPLCGSAAGYSLDAYRTKEDARDALAKIEVVDRSGHALQAADLALEACGQASELSKRVIFFGDQQRINWPANTLAPQWQKLPEFQVVDVSPDLPENTWIADFRVQDAIADVETETSFVATLRYEGPSARSGVQVALSVDDVEISTKTVDLEPGQILPVAFNYRFDIQPERGRPKFIKAKVMLPPDRLPQDDERHLVVPVVAALPVVFVDQYGERENPQKNIYGETHHLRRLLSPITNRGDSGRQLIQIRHTSVEGLNRDMLEDARLVVMAGVDSPGPAVRMLKEYVQQGGQLMIAAGGEFDPAVWNRAAWLDGEGILPLPLKPEPLGRVPDPDRPPAFFQLAFASMNHDYFILPDEPQESLIELYREPYFFKAVQVDGGDDVVTALVESEASRLGEQLEFVLQSDESRQEWAQLEARGKLSGADREARDEDAELRAEIEPEWLLWDDERTRLPTSERPDEDETVPELAKKLAEATRPRVLASFENGVPYLVERKIGRGRVLLSTSGVFSEWNTLHTTNTMLVFDRILRNMLESTLPRRNFDTASEVTLPVRGNERRGRFVLTRPDGSTEDLLVEALGRDKFGLSIRDLTARGTYSVAAYRPDSAAIEEEGIDAKLWEVPLAVNGPAEESELVPIDEEELARRMGEANYRWIGRNAQISLEGAAVTGQNMWWWLILAVLVLLLIELLILAWPALAIERAAVDDAGEGVAA